MFFVRNIFGKLTEKKPNLIFIGCILLHINMQQNTGGGTLDTSGATYLNEGVKEHI